ncbi:MAG: hypothetical protein NUV88_01985, partial [Candidatus Kaiserbacteria bacterium]|nr:hypothetical protein [Candidatus Kaiserbacteria bacterium]
MKINKNILGYSFVLLAAFMLAGLAGWYFFLHQKTQTISATDAARGLGTSDSSFTDAVSNTYDNIVSGITSLVTGTSTPSSQGDSAPPQLWQITKTPAAGMSFVATGSSTKLYFAENSTGYILTADPQTGTLGRLTNKLFPKTQEAVFGQGTVVLRSIDDNGGIASFAGSMSSSTSADGTYAFTGKSLEQNISAIVSAPLSNGFLYLTQNIVGGSEGVLSSADGAKRKVVFSSPLSGWRPISLADGRTFFVLHPADNVPGFAYELRKDGSLVLQIGGLPGLTFLPNTSSTAVIYGTSENGSLSLFVRTREDASVISLPIKTTAEKCVWSTEMPAIAQSTTTPKTSSKKPSAVVKPLIAYCAVPQFLTSNTFLNDWYKGAIRTSDSWWRVDVSAGAVELLLSPSA